MQKEGEEPTLRLCQVERPSTGSCGFHLSRTAWDPYPWVSGVEEGSPADVAGLQTGDCVLEVNGEDVLGQRISEVASRVRSRGDRVTLLLWNAGSDPHVAAANISGSGPTPLSLQRLSSCLQSILQLLECPVCLETVPPPAYQCCHGHILCGNCRARADKCPVCRVSLGSRGRCLLADKLHNLLTTTLNRSVRNKQTHSRNKKTSFNHQQQLPLLYLKSRIITKIHDSTFLISKNREANENVAIHNFSQPTTPGDGPNTGNTSGPQEISEEVEVMPTKAFFAESMQKTVAYLDQVDDGISERKLLQPKVSSEENISISARRLSEQLSSAENETTPVRPRSLSAEQIIVRNNTSIHESQRFIEKIVPSNQMDELLFHCPYPTKSVRHCQHTCVGIRMLLQHLKEAHAGPLIQYFIQPSRSVTKLRLPLSSSKSTSSSLISFTLHGDTVFFIQVAVGATPGHRLVWLWILADALQADRYRLRLTMPEGDTHTGPVFPLTSSWTDVVNSNCCLSIEERRYLRGNPEVQIEILDIAKTN